MNKHIFSEACHSIMIGSHIKSMRKKYGLKQRHLAALLGLKTPAICRIEKGIYGISLYQAKILNDYFRELAKKDAPHDPIAF